MSTLAQPTANTTITALQFNQYTTIWMEALEGPDDLTDQLLQSCFEIGNIGNNDNSSNSRIGQFSFQADDIISVLSTVGLHTIMVQFGITTKHSLFTPILVGYNRSGLQVTPYYVGYIHEANPLSGQTPDLSTDYTFDQVPDVLADKWITQWHNVETIDKSLFQTSFGYLRGYTFLMQDFLDGVSLLKRDKGTYVVVYLALHQYFGSDNQLKSTFGLVISAQSSTTHLPASGDSHADTIPIPIPRQVFYDLSAPCPPTCRITQLQ